MNQVVSESAVVSESKVESEEGEPVAEAPSEEIVVPIVKYEYNFLNAVFLARNDALLKEPDMQSGGTFVEFGGDTFLNTNAYKNKLFTRFNRKKSNDVIDGLVSNRRNLTQELNNDIRDRGENFNQSLQAYQNNDHILYDFCAEVNRGQTTDKYVFLIRNRGDSAFRLPEGPNGEIFVPEMNDQNIIIVFLEVVVDDGRHYYDLVVSKNTTDQNIRYPFCARYVIKKGSAGTLGCNLENMGKQQAVVSAIDLEIAKNGPNKARLEAFKNVVSEGLNPSQRDAVKIADAVAEEVGAPTETNTSTDSGSVYTPSLNDKLTVNTMFANLPSFSQTLVPEENVCADKTLIELLKTSLTQRPPLFSGGRRYKKTTRKRRGAPLQQKKTTRRAHKNV